MQKWEYRLVDTRVMGGGEEMERLLKAGDDGWEAVSAFILPSIGGEGFARPEIMRVLLKRPKLN